jgi:hypothetical protein
MKRISIICLAALFLAVTAYAKPAASPATKPPTFLTCSETDNGDDPDTAGITSTQLSQSAPSMAHPDTCGLNKVNGATLTEYWCNSGEMFSRFVTCVGPCQHDAAKGADYCPTKM